MSTTYVESAVVKEYLDKAKRKTKCQPNKQELDDLKDVLRIEGAHQVIWDMAVEQIEVSLKRNSRLSREKLTNVIIAYRDLCDRNVLADCPICNKSGFVLVVVLHRGKKTYIYDPQNLNMKANLMNAYMAGKPFTGEVQFQPCTCKNGDKANKKRADYWNSDPNRRRCRERCFMGPDAEFNAQEHCDMINAIAKGRNYDIRNPEEEYKKIKPTIEAMKAELADKRKRGEI